MLDLSRGVAALGRLAAVCAVGGLTAGCVGVAAPVTQPVGYGPAAPVYAPASITYGGQCFAGPYRCRLSAIGPIGNPCTCPGIGAPSYGRIR